jgi:hypothetical protein
VQFSAFLRSLSSTLHSTKARIFHWLREEEQEASRRVRLTYDANAERCHEVCDSCCYRGPTTDVSYDDCGVCMQHDNIGAWILLIRGRKKKKEQQVGSVFWLVFFFLFWVILRTSKGFGLVCGELRGSGGVFEEEVFFVQQEQRQVELLLLEYISSGNDRSCVAT